VTGISVTVRSPAKINWCLRVLGRREDGFHDIISLVSTVTLFDDLEFIDRDAPGINLDCDRDDVPTDERNLIVRAGMLLAEAAGIEARARCRLVKRIPVGGGLGGGSSNGANSLMAFNQLWGLNWSADRLAPVAARLGSDVSFFLWGGSAVISGRGEHVRPVPLQWNGWIVLLLPPFSISTAQVYARWRPPETVPASTPMDDVLNGETLAPGGAIGWMKAAYNMLEEPLVSLCPAVRPLMEAGSELAGRPVRVSGSGSTLFTAFDTRAEAESFARQITKRMDIGTRLVQLSPAGAVWNTPAQARPARTTKPRPGKAYLGHIHVDGQREGGRDGDH
jgi:4-diphosphocytidyl-2-C-methyl-D-erythritol kinase